MPKHALVVDDDSAPARLISRFLERLGWGVTVASSGGAALKAFQTGTYDLTICDVNLGDIDGIILATTFRQREPSLKIIIISGRPENIDRARTAGFQHCLSKPFNLDDFMAMVEAPGDRLRSRNST